MATLSLVGPSAVDEVLQKFFKMSEDMRDFGEDVSDGEDDEEAPLDGGADDDDGAATGSGSEPDLDEAAEATTPFGPDDDAEFPYDPDVVDEEGSMASDAPLSEDAQEANVARQTAAAMDVTRRDMFVKIVSDVLETQRTGRVASGGYASTAQAVLGRLHAPATVSRITRLNGVVAAAGSSCEKPPRCVVTGAAATGLATVALVDGNIGRAPVHDTPAVLATLGLAVVLNRALSDARCTIYEKNSAEEAARIIMHALLGLRIAFQ